MDGSDHDLPENKTQFRIKRGKLPDCGSITENNRETRIRTTYIDDFKSDRVRPITGNTQETRQSKAYLNDFNGDRVGPINKNPNKKDKG